ncbi:hypothetical protein H5410_037275 [Solanum commersonii]|uniref:Uncharacterized protein n=1 Tax=Solanum commersonii TaxID=4109 RepID=A0A9J5Y5T4_SOLCO|nr:hypothetical protein H5410_037275 [Solanum commersonii]
MIGMSSWLSVRERIWWKYLLLSRFIAYVEAREYPEYQVWFQEDRDNISPEGEKGFEDIGMTIWIRHSRLGTKIVTREMWAQMENIMRYLNNVETGIHHSYFTRSKAHASTDMTNSGASDQNGLGLIVVLRYEPEASEGRDPIPYDEHIANLMQKMANMQSEIDRLRNLTNLSITPNTPFFEHGTNTTIPPPFHLLTLFLLNTSHQILPFTRPIQLLPNNPPTLNNLTFHKTIYSRPTIYPSLPNMCLKLHLPKLQSSKLTHLPKTHSPKPSRLPKNTK